MATPFFLSRSFTCFLAPYPSLALGVEVPYVDYGKLQLAIERQLELSGLQRVDSLITKIIQVRAMAS